MRSKSAAGEPGGFQVARQLRHYVGGKDIRKGFSLGKSSEFFHFQSQSRIGHLLHVDFKDKLIGFLVDLIVGRRNRQVLFPKKVNGTGEIDAGIIVREFPDRGTAGGLVS